MKFSGGSLDALKTDLAKKIDAEAETIRAAIITLDAGMALIYPRKENEANAFMDAYMAAGQDEQAVAVYTPHIAAEASKLMLTKFEVASGILMSAHWWTEMSAIIEPLRVYHRQAVLAATSADAARAAAIVPWPALNP